MINLETYFTVTAKCGYNVEEYHEEKRTVNQKIEHKEFQLKLTSEDAEKILFKFSPMKFKISGGYVIQYIYFVDEFKAMFIIHEGKAYIVTNHEQLIRDVHEGYMKLYSMKKFTDMLDFDFAEAVSLAKDDLGRIAKKYREKEQSETEQP